MQLSLAVFPLVQFTSDKVKMGALVNPRWLAVLAYVTATLIAALNGWLLIQTLQGWLT
jgi:manganese transport protein